MVPGSNKNRRPSSFFKAFVLKVYTRLSLAAVAGWLVVMNGPFPGCSFSGGVPFFWKRPNINGKEHRITWELSMSGTWKTSIATWGFPHYHHTPGGSEIRQAPVDIVKNSFFFYKVLAPSQVDSRISEPSTVYLHLMHVSWPYYFAKGSYDVWTHPFKLKRGTTPNATESVHPTNFVQITHYGWSTYPPQN